MGYIQLTKGVADFSKMVISFWFRVPEASFEKVRTAPKEAGDPFDGIIPLLVIGKRGTGTIPHTLPKSKALQYNTTGYEMFDLYHHISITEVLSPTRARRSFTYNPHAHIESFKGTIDGDIKQLSVDGEAPPTNPTFIGVDAAGRLFVNFETAEKPDVSAFTFIRSGFTPGSIDGHGPSDYEGPVPSPPGPHDAYPTGTQTIEYDWFFHPDFIAGNVVVIENTTRWQQWPILETVLVKATSHFSDISDTVVSATGAIESNEIDAPPDHWHHVLVSIELKTIQTHGTSGDVDITDHYPEYVDSAAKLHVALDDENFTEYDLSAYWTEGDPNEVVTHGAYDVLGSFPHRDDDGNILGIASYVLTDPKIPGSKAALGLPATAEFVENIYTVEMAELQIFTGVTLDTGIVGNRRAFVDRDGVPVAPLPWVDDAGNPRPMPSAALLGKDPEIVLHGSDNWARGYNTGTLGYTGEVDEEGRPIVDPRGQFVPTGNILPWTPDPTLHGPQGGTPPPAVRLTRKPVAAE